MERKTFTLCPFWDKETGLCTYNKGRLELIFSSIDAFFDPKSWLGVPKVAVVRNFNKTDPNTGKKIVTRLLFCGGNRNLPLQRYCNGNPNKDRELPDDFDF